MAMTIEQKRAVAIANARLRLQQNQGDVAGRDAEISSLLPSTSIPQNLTWSQVGQKALENTPGSAYQFGSDIVDAVRHPVRTADSMLDLAAGGISRGIEYATGNQDLFPENKATQTADAVGNFYKNRYGSVKGFKNALAQDPVGVLGDAATVLTGGEGAAIRALGPASRTAKILGTASRVVNPLTVPELVGGTAKTVLGATTGTSADTIGEAFQAGRAGGDASTTFRDNIRGKVGQGDVIDEAKQALGNIAEQRDKNYQIDMRSIKADKTPLDMAPIEKTFQDLVDSMYHEGNSAVSDKTISVLKDIGTVIDEWSKDPKMQNAIGFDILKRRIDDLMPVIGDSRKTAQAERAVTKMRNAVKKVIVDRFPQYKTAMENYEKSIRAQKEIEKTLSLGKKNSADQTLRKLQSVTRNNVNTNYGARSEMVRQLEAAGAPNLTASLSGQALNSWMPRGLLGPVLAGGGGALGAYANPAFLAALPFFSPRLVGEATRGVGASARYLDAIPKPTKAQLLLLRQLGIAVPPEQQ